MDSLPRIDPLFIAWLAGFIDGEGCFHIARMTAHRKTDGQAYFNYSPMLVISNTDRQPLDEIVATLALGRVQAQRTNGQHVKWKGSFQLHARGPQAQAIALLTLPYLRIKRPQAQALIDFPVLARNPNQWNPIPPETQAERERLYATIRTLNAKGPAIEK